MLKIPTKTNPSNFGMDVSYDQSIEIEFSDISKEDIEDMLRDEELT